MNSCSRGSDTESALKVIWRPRSGSGIGKGCLSVIGSSTGSLGVTMTAISSPLSAALDRVWSALEPLEAPMAVLGGLSLAVWSHPRSTHDVDILIYLDEERVDEALEALANAGARFRRQPPVVSLGDVDLVQALYEPPKTFLEIQIDVLLARSSAGVDEAVERLGEDTVAEGWVSRTALGETVLGFPASWKRRRRG